MLDRDKVAGNYLEKPEDIPSHLVGLYCILVFFNMLKFSHLLNLTGKNRMKKLMIATAILATTSLASANSTESTNKTVTTGHDAVKSI
ncbi:MAG: hypothetical protein ABW158_02300, partial [Candidatus Thiodiazotropha sp. 6PDIVS]